MTCILIVKPAIGIAVPLNQPHSSRGLDLVIGHVRHRLDSLASLETHFTDRLWARNRNLVKVLFFSSRMSRQPSPAAVHNMEHAHTRGLIDHHYFLTSYPLDKVATISQTLFSDAFSWMTSFVFWLKIHWSLFQRVQLTITQHWFR